MVRFNATDYTATLWSQIARSDGHLNDPRHQAFHGHGNLHHRARSAPLRADNVRRIRERRAVLRVEIRTVHADLKQRYGSPRIYAAPNAAGVGCCINTVAKLMHDNDIRAKTARTFRNTTDSNHTLSVADNLLDRRFDAQGSNERWLGDITSIRARQGWLYLVVEDLYAQGRRLVDGRSHDQPPGRRCLGNSGGPVVVP